MTTKKPDGGPAFPVFDASQNIAVFGGMTLRDHFAGQAMRDVVALYPSAHHESVVASRAYAIADAMLAERAK